jgi:hypothetical protein
MFHDWIEMHKAIRAEQVRKELCVCPECGSQTIDLQFVGDEKSRIGYLDIWCATCKRGIHMSRVVVPESESLISFDAPSEVIAARIPDFEQLSPERS